MLTCVVARACSDDVEELLKGERLYVQCEFALFQLYPACEEIVLCIDVLQEFVDVLLPVAALHVSLCALREALYLVQETVDERRDGIDDVHLRPLLDIELLLPRDLHPFDGAVFLQLFYLVVELLDKLPVGILHTAERGMWGLFA